MVNYTALSIILYVLFVIVLTGTLWYNYYRVENFAGNPTLNSSALRTLLSSHLQSEQKLSKDLGATVDAELLEGKQDLDEAQTNFEIARDKLVAAKREFDARNLNAKDIKSLLNARIPPVDNQNIDPAVPFNPLMPPITFKEQEIQPMKLSESGDYNFLK
jgi:hypothetical protein